MMQPYQEQAWDCLTKDEQQSLLLTLSQGMSTWQASEILKITHYKYLELKARSERLFKLFSDYFEKHPSFIPPKTNLTPSFRDYLYGSMIKRLPKEEARVYAGDSAFLLRAVSNDQILKNMLRLKEAAEDGDEWLKDLYALIMEFDRWNNYRILPRILQAPTAYQRRSTKKDKIYLRYLHRIPEFKIRALVDMYWSNGKPEYRYYVMFISELWTDGFGVVPIKRDHKIVKELTNLKIYIFEDQLTTEEFGIMVKRYYEKTITPGEGLKFWRKYRELVQSSINYREINNMDFSCEALDQAYNLKRNSIRKMTELKRKREAKSKS